MLLQEIIDKNHFCFAEEASDWQASIRLACQPLEADGTVTPEYAQEIIDCVEKHGPYIVIMPNFALPHSMEGSKGANGTAISFMKLQKPVSFDPNDSEKDASVFFTLAAVDSEEHLKNMQNLFGLLTNPELVEDLQKVENEEDFRRLAQKYA